ncbi:DUF2878 domain-containing protein [Vibrio palustris]|uniref:Uncharacterized protein n=1 Tax=Vibrio palustris TaxID=1918946 RepID=A0A1R4B319_9VIBR|nr:DUF2878 domain-containing protein [Vibrio palustris]SJL83309.1 hypothetical protein VPAL9027_01275 [Vibrio palustris]
MWQLLVISIWFQALWFMAVLGQTEWQWGSTALLGVTLVASLKCNQSRWRWWAGVTLIGIVLDSLNTLLGLFQFTTAVIPIWLMVLWGAFAWYSWYLMPIMTRWPRPIQVLGSGLSGSLSYLAGAHWQAVELPQGQVISVIILILEWAILIQYLIWKREQNHD